jgi:PAS domain S-box-containing protein
MLLLNSITVKATIYESANSLVYRGIKNYDNTPVILKVLKEDYPNPQEIVRYKKEYAITRSLNLEGVIKAYSQQEYQRSLVIVLEDFGGESLVKWMKLSPEAYYPMPLSEFLSLAIKITEILGNIHSSNVIHKDINPGNIVLNPETGQVKIIDFGISTRLTSNSLPLVHPHGLEGTLAYMSPEQTGRMNRTLDYRTDFYSLGVTFYELLTGKLPFTTDDVLELVHCHIAKQPVPPKEGRRQRAGGRREEVPQSVSDIVMKLLAKNAEDRYQSAWGIQADLEECLRQVKATGRVENFRLGSQDISNKFQIPQKLYGREAEIETLLAAFKRVAGGELTSPPIPLLQEEGSPTSPFHKEKVSSSVLPPRRMDRGGLEGRGGLGCVEMMLVAGYSGIGKSALVQEIYKPITEKRGYFISGKFDQLQRNIPYSAVVHAFGGLMRQLLSESEAQLRQWQEKILAALGPNAQVIIDVIPEVELIIGKQPPVPELGGAESQNRFNLVFQNFIRVFCTKEYPLVIFLDDLQWVDSATLKLIELMMTDIDTQYLFLIGAYRDNEVNSTHSLMMTLDELRRQEATINQITLAPLELEPLSHLIADTLHSDTDSVKPLAELVKGKTEGNPFFVNEFLKTLYAENLLVFPPPASLIKGGVREDSLNSPPYQGGVRGGKSLWQWDIAQIEAQNITDNVVELTIAKLKKLPQSTQEVLRLAGCSGANFDLDTLSIICQKSESVIFQDLLIAIESGLILPVSEFNTELLIQDYKFLHDRVQEAAYSLIDEAQKQVVHLQIGRLLLQNTQPEFLLEEIFQIIDHLNLGVELVTHQQERDKIAKLNLMAGEKAKAATAYDAAVEYFNAGIKLLSAQSWQNEYDLTLALYEEAAAAAYLNGDFIAMEQLAEVVLNHAKTTLDKVKVYNSKIQAAVSRTKLKEAIKIGLQVLEQLGVSLPENPSQLDIQKAFEETAALYIGRKIEDLINLPKITEPELQAAIHIMSSITVAAYAAAPELVLLLSISQANLSIKHGNSTSSTFGYGCYSAILCASFQDIETGYKFGKLGLKLLERLNAVKNKAQVFNVFCGCVMFWKEHLRKTIPMLSEGYQSGVETGDFECASGCAFFICNHLYFFGDELTEIDRKTAAYSNSIRQLRREQFLNWTLTSWQAVQNLLGQTENPCKLIGNAYNEERALPYAIAVNDRSQLHLLHLHKLILSYLFGEYDQAIENAAIAEQYLDGVIAQLVMAIFYFYDSLAHLRLLAETSNPDKEVLLNRVNSNQAKMQHWAHHAPMNFLHKFHLVEAEKARVLGQVLAAEEYYEQAIDGAKENGYLQEEALAYELAAKFYLERGRLRFAQTYMKEAHYTYTIWGAKAKVNDLEAKYPQLLTKSSTAKSITSTRTTHPKTTTGSQSGETLDLATVMKASQAISGEIVLDKLLSSLMKILIENTGAQTGFLLLEKAGQWVIEASGTVNSDNVPVFQSLSIDNHLPTSIINYVVRTKEIVVFNDAASEIQNPPPNSPLGKGGTKIQNLNDPYIKAHQTKSLLCVPLINQGQLSGIVYLENNLTIGAFTPKRLEILQLLSGQAAIAITNAKLYAEVHASERRLTQFLEAIPVGIGVLDASGKPYYANRTAIELLGKGVVPSATAEQLGEVYQLYITGTDQQYPSEQMPTVRALRGECTTIDDVEIHHPDRVIPIESRGTPIFDEKGNVAYAIVAFQDITARKQAQKLLTDYNHILEAQVAERTEALRQQAQELKQTLERLQRTQTQLIQAEKMSSLGQMVAGIAHEINNPTSFIYGNISPATEYAQNLLHLIALYQQYYPEPVAEIAAQIDAIEPNFIAEDFPKLLASIRQGAERIMQIVLSLRNFSRLDERECKRVDIHQGIDNTLVILQHRLKPQSHRPEIQVIKEYSELPNVECYAAQLNQVFINILNNAIDALENVPSSSYSLAQEASYIVHSKVAELGRSNEQSTMNYEQSPTIWISTEVVEQNKVVIRIANNGSAIDPVLQSKIFDPFFTTKPVGKGTGLGLSISYQIVVERHNGELTCHSTPGQRTEFVIALPITQGKKSM